MACYTQIAMPVRPARTFSADELWEYALEGLADRAHSAGELREKLRRKASRAGDVDATLARLNESGYLDDRAYAESYAHARLDDRQFGSMRVLRDLRERRVAPSLAERAVRHVFAHVDEEALAEEYVRRKYRAAPRAELFRSEKDLAAAYRKLLRAGFGTGVIIRVLKRFAGDPDLLDAFEPPPESEEETK